YLSMKWMYSSTNDFLETVTTLEQQSKSTHSRTSQCKYGQIRPIIRASKLLSHRSSIRKQNIPYPDFRQSYYETPRKKCCLTPNTLGITLTLYRMAKSAIWISMP